MRLKIIIMFLFFYVVALCFLAAITHAETPKADCVDVAGVVALVNKNLPQALPYDVIADGKLYVKLLGRSPPNNVQVDQVVAFEHASLPRVLVVGFYKGCWVATITMASQEHQGIMKLLRKEV